MIRQPRRPTVRVSIDRLVLNGFTPAAGAAVRAAFEAELSRQLAAAAEAGFTPGDDAGRTRHMPVAATSDARAVGVGSARRVAQDVSRAAARQGARTR